MRNRKFLSFVAALATGLTSISGLPTVTAFAANTELVSDAVLTAASGAPAAYDMEDTDIAGKYVTIESKTAATNHKGTLTLDGTGLALQYESNDGNSQTVRLTNSGKNSWGTRNNVTSGEGRVTEYDTIIFYVPENGNIVVYFNGEETSNKLSNIDNTTVTGLTWTFNQWNAVLDIKSIKVSDTFEEAIAAATPTVPPTAAPTVPPTAAPTVPPTATPTVPPTATPTVPPTATPTVPPTATPTVPPTATPTIPPASDPTGGLSYWTLPEAKYSDDFTGWVNNSSGIPEYNGTWTLYNGGRANDTYLKVRNDNGTGNAPVIALAWKGSATYTTAPKTGIYYYRYDIAMWDKSTANQNVKLEGISYGIVIESPLSNTAKHTFTTVVDADNSKAYTYDEAGELIVVSNIADGEKITGITFECLDGSSALWIYNFNYGIIVEGAPEPTAEPAPTQEPTPTPGPGPSQKPDGYPAELSYWTLNDASYTEPFKISSTDNLDDGWTLGNTSGGVTNPKHITVSENERIELKWYGSASYTGSAENGSYYYTYKIRMNDNSGNNRVSLEGLTDGAVISSVSQGSGSGPYYTFTTVIDIYSTKAYTYNEKGDIVSEIEIPSGESVTGIKFGAYNNTTSSMLVEDFSYGLVNVEIAEPETIRVKSGDVNDGEPLEKDKTYTVKSPKFEAAEFSFDAPSAVLADGTAPIYLSSTMDIASASGSLPSGITIDGRAIKTTADLLSGEYPLIITVKAICAGSTMLTETYNITVIKEEITPDDIMNDYEPVVKSLNAAVSDHDTVTEDIVLPASSGLMTIDWTSSAPAVIASNGSLTRPLNDTEVTLTAKITANADTSKSKTYTITVNVPGAGAMLSDAIAEAKAALVSADNSSKIMDLEKLADLHEDVRLYTEYKNTEYTGHEKVVISYSSNNDALKIKDGIAGIYPTEVKKYNAALKVKASIGATEVTEEIPVTINLTPDNAADKYAVRCDDIAPANFTVPESVKGTTVASDITLPVKGIFGSTISWTSSVPMYLSNTGKYTAPSYAASATVTGIVSHGTLISETTHPYTLTLKGKNTTNASSGGGGGGGGGTATKSSTFTVPAAAAATQTPAPAPQNNTSEPGTKGFTDLGSAAWAETAINALADKGIVSGKSDSIFAPNDNVTRAEFAKIIVNAFGFADDNATTDVFTDVDGGEWYAPFIAAAYNNGIINGYDDGRFGVNDNITRQDMAVIIYRAAERAGIEPGAVNEEIVFEDAENIADYARTAVTALQKAGIINGISDTEFAPVRNATRAQSAKMVYEIIK